MRASTRAVLLIITLPVSDGCFLLPTQATECSALRPCPAGSSCDPEAAVCRPVIPDIGADPTPAPRCPVSTCPAVAGRAMHCNVQGYCEYKNPSASELSEQYDTWIYVPPGPFSMGSPADEPGHAMYEGPVHTVTLGAGFFIAKPLSANMT